jgi:integrase
VPEHLTQRTLARLDPEGTGKRYFVYGSNPVGLGIEVSAKGKASYFVEIRIKGRRSATRKKIGSVDLISLSDAQAEAKAMLGDAAKGIDFRYSAQEEEIRPETVGYALEQHLTEKRHSLRDSTIRDYQKTFNNCFSDWRTLPLKQLTKKRVTDRYLELRDSGKSSDYVNKAFRNLSSTLSYYDVEPNPIRVLKQKGLRQSGTARERFLSQDEIVQIMQHHLIGSKRDAKGTKVPKITRIFMFFMLTGLRANEVIGLKWKDVQDGYFIITGDVAKNKKPHKMPLVGSLKSIVGQRKKDDDPVFGYTQSGYRTAKDKFLEATKMAHFTTHDFRRTFSEHLNLCGYSELDIAVANNQSSTNVTTKHYLGGELAKASLQVKMLTDLQNQFEFYLHGDSKSNNPQKAPERWEETVFVEPDISNDDIREYLK